MSTLINKEISEIADVDSEFIRSMQNYNFSMENAKNYEQSLSRISEDSCENDEESSNDSPSMELLDCDNESELEAPKMSSTLVNVENSVELPEADTIKTPWSQPQISYREFEKRLHLIESKSPPRRSNDNIYLPKDRNFRKSLETQELTLGSPVLNSPRMIFNSDKIISVSPNLRFVKERNESDSISRIKRENRRARNSECSTENLQSDLSRGAHIRKYRTKRPPDLEIPENMDENDLRNPSTINRRFIGAFNTREDSGTPVELFDEIPPIGRVLDEDQAKIALLLNTYGLAHMIQIFLEQEVDVELFYTLNDQDLREIGIKRQSDRNILLSIIADCNRCKI